MGRPVDMDGIVNSAGSPEVASEIHLASLLAIDTDTAAEKAYLAMLAARLNLPAELVGELHRPVEAQTPDRGEASDCWRMPPAAAAMSLMTRILLGKRTCRPPLKQHLTCPLIHTYRNHAASR